MRIKNHLVRFSPLKIKFEPRDIWVGVYWDDTKSHLYKSYMIYICILPTLPIVVSFSVWFYYYEGKDSK